MGGDTETRERLELEDFEDSADGEDFDPVQWLNARLAKSGVSFDRLDQHLSSLGMSCQLLCQDTSGSIDFASDQLVAQLPSTGRDLERMRNEALRGKEQLGSVLEGLEDADDRKRSGLHGLAEIDVVKTRVEMACSALREVGSWERKVRDCEQMVHGGNLPAALRQLTSLKGVLDAFRMLPEYAKKEDQLGQIEESLISNARRRARLAVERNVAADLRACREVFSGMNRHSEPAAIATSVFVELAEKAWQSREPRSDAPASASAGALSAAAGAALEALAQALEERWPLLQSLEATEVSPDGHVDVEAVEAAAAAKAVAELAPTGVLASAVRTALSVLSAKLEACLAVGASDGVAAAAGAGTDGEEESSAHARAARAVGLLAAYVDGFAALAGCTPLAKAPGLWLEVCRDVEGSEVVPWGLLREVALFVIWRPMQDDAMALVPPAHAQMRPSEAVLAAESNAKRLLQMPASWARRLEQQGAGQLASVWLACIDETCSSYWRQWDKLIETFQNTLQAKRDAAADTSLLNECMQLHGILHDSIPAQVASFQAEVLQLAARMGAASSVSPFGRALSEKLRDPGVWCERLNVPSSTGLRSAHGSLDGARPDSAALTARASRALPASAAALEGAEKQVRRLVTECCVQPATASLTAYPEAPEWVRAEEQSEAPVMAGGLSPLQCITAVGEHLFALVPQLERSQDSPQLEWLPAILDAVVDIAMQKVMLIRRLTSYGARQLAADLEYLQKVADALGSAASPAPPSAVPATSADGSAAAGAAAGAASRLAEFLEALNYLAAQQRRREECDARGEAFVEVPREGPPLNRRSERALRVALGLERGVGV